jgi:hypothetical protein
MAVADFGAVATTVVALRAVVDSTVAVVIMATADTTATVDTMEMADTMAMAGITGTADITTAGKGFFGSESWGSPALFYLASILPDYCLRIHVLPRSYIRKRFGAHCIAFSGTR